MSFIPRALPKTALAALLAAASLCGHAAVPAPIPVVVSNTPLAVDTSAAQPFATSATLTLDANGEGFKSFNLPAGKRLVVQLVSMYRVQLPTVGSSVQVYVIGPLNGVTNYYALAPCVAVGSRFPGVSQAMNFYIDAGSTAQIAAYGTPSSANGSIQVQLTGYLVNTP